MLSLRLATVIIVVACGPFQFGYNTGVINAPEKIIKQYLNETSIAQTGESYADLTTAWAVVVAMFPVGGMLGSLGVGYAANFFGRRMLMFILSIGGIIAGLVLGLAKTADSYAMLVVGRILVGFVSGAYTGVTPMYLSEVSPVAIRGSIGVVNQLATVLAILISQILGLQQLLGTADSWPLLLGLTAVPAAIEAALVLIVCPESPRYLLITKSDETAARRTLKVLGTTYTEAEESALIREMKREAEEQKREKTLSVFDMFRRRELLWPLIIAVVMQLSQQFSGINGIFYYSAGLFEKAGLSPEDAGLATLGVGAIMVVTTIISIPLIDRAGRKILHSVGLGGMLFAAIAVTIFLSLRDNFSWAGPVGVAFSLLFVMFFAIGPGSIPWLITAELFAQSARPAAIAIATFVNWSANFVIGMAFPPVQEQIDQYVFVIFSVLLLCFLLFTLKFVPETKGRTFQEIAAYFSSKSSKSPASFVSSEGNGNSPESAVGIADFYSNKSEPFLPLPNTEKLLISTDASQIGQSHQGQNNGQGSVAASNDKNTYLSITHL